VNCQIAQNSLSAYLDRELAGDQMIAVRSHVEHCPDCQSELETLRSVKSRLASLPVFEPREGFAEDVLRLVRNDDGQAASIPVGLMVATSVAAAVLAVLAFNAFFGRPATPQYASDDTRFDAASDSALTSSDFGSHAPIIPVGR
jgi:anti-sigma factor RsiW